MKETLTCTQCEKRWRREKSRGRKPHLCPKCVKATTKTQPVKKTVVQVVEVKKPKKIRRITRKQIQASTENNNENKLTVGEIYQYFHPANEKLKEETKGGSTWKCRCGYTIQIKFSLTATPTHKCSDGSKPIQMERIE